MDFITLICIALGLAADAFAVSVTNGMCSRKVTRRNAFLTGIFFGFFQALMPVLGFFLGRSFSLFIHRFQHWVALFLLGAIGLNMLVEAARDHKNMVVIQSSTNLFTLKNLSLQGIATSIDALAAGVSFAVMQINIYIASILIGIITFYCCFFGVCIGKLFGELLGMRARFLGGLILITTGIKIFIEHQI